MASGLVFDIRRFCVHDGPGIRTTVFLKGCPLSCAWCHNPEGISLSPQMAWRRASCARCGACVAACPHGAITMTEAGPEEDPVKCRRCGLCAEACPTGARIRVGRWMTVGELVAEVVKDRPFFEESSGGVTFSGGEPTLQMDFLIACCQGLRSLGVHVAVDTCAFGPPEGFERLLDCVDLVLVDLKAATEEQSLRWTGAPLGMILTNARRLAQSGKASFAVPLVPGANDDPRTLKGIAAVLNGFGVERVSILPYHAWGRDKLERFSAVQAPTLFREPSPEELDQVIRLFLRYGITAQVGGRGTL